MRARQIFLQLAEQNSNVCLIDTSGHLKDTWEKALNAFQLAAINKIGTSAAMHPEMLNLSLVFFGEDRIDRKFEAGTPEMDALLYEARRRSH